MGNVKISTKDLEELINGMENIQKGVSKVAEGSLNEMTQVTIAQAKKNTPKGEDTLTHLRDHYFATEMVKKANEYSRDVRNDARSEKGEYYAGYFEHGHRTRLGTSSNPKYKPKSGAKAWVKGRFPLFRATVDARNKSEKIITRNMKKYFEGK